MITKQMKMAELIHLNYLLLPIISRFGINLGFGDKTIEEVCNEYSVNSDFFIEIVNAFHDKNYFPEKQLQTFSISLIINYLKKTHQFYLSRKLPEMEQLIVQMIELSQPPVKNQIVLIKRFFDEYHKEFAEHIKREEEEVYPYVLIIEEIYTGKQKKQLKGNEQTITFYAREHGNVEEKLFDLKNILIKYLPPVTDPNVSNLLLAELFKMESDLNDHQRIEETVMVPKVIAMENEILAKK